MSKKTFNRSIIASAEESLTTESSTSIVKAQSDIIYGKRRMVQNFLLIWMDANLNLFDAGCQNTVLQLRNVVNDVNIFTKPDECIDFLTDIDDQKVFMIVAESIAEQLISLINEIPQLDVIYIFCVRKDQHEQWAKEWSKIKGVYTEMTHVSEALEIVVKQCNQDFAAISFINVGEGTSNQNLDQLEPSFMYTQIFKEILLEMEYDEQSIKDLVVFCRQQYIGNTRQIKIIDEFARDYRTKSPIWWYTRECFTYQMLNQALRTMDGEIIIMMGFFIRELHYQIEQLHQQQFDSYHGESFTVYRGQGLPEIDFDKLLKTKGGLLSFNNFLSTSKNYEVSLTFAKKASVKSDTIGILFNMSVNPTVSSAAFAAIRETSYYRKEEEVLFSMHTVFRIGAINKIENTNCLYEVELTLTADDDQQLRTVTNHIREETEGSGWERVGALLFKIGQFNKAEELYRILLHQASDDAEKSLYYNQLGIIKINQGQYEEATSFHEKSLEIAQKDLSSNHSALAQYYNNLAVTYCSVGEYSKVLSLYKKALDICEKTLPADHSLLAKSYNNVGEVYRIMGEYSTALSFYEKALRVFEEILPLNHPDLADPYSNIAAVYYSMGDHPKALLFYEKVLEIIQKTFSPSHPSLATYYNNVATMHNNMAEYSKALLFYQKAFDIFQKHLSPNHPSLAPWYNNVGEVYRNMREYSKALSFYEKALDISLQTLSPTHPSLATLYNNAGEVYQNMGEHSKALSFYGKAIDIFEKTLPPNHPDFATLNNNVATMYNNMAEYSKALLFYEKAFDIFKKTLPPNHPSLASWYNNVGEVYRNMGEYSKALSFCEKALEIFQRTLLPNHPSLALLYNNVGNIHRCMEKYSKALTFYEKTREIYQKTFPADHPNFAMFYNNVGGVYHCMGEFTKALSCFKRAYEISQKMLPKNHPLLTTICENIDAVYIDMK